MKKQNKRLLRILSLVCCLLIGFGQLTACKKPKSPDVPADDRTPIMENGSTQYRIVRGDNATDAEKAAASALCDAIRNKTGVSIEITTDLEVASLNLFRTDYEILVGQTNRDENPNPQYCDYGFIMPTTRICIYGGSQDALNAAIEKFISECVSEKGVFFPKNGFQYQGDYSMKDEEIGGIALSDFEEIVCYSEKMLENGYRLADSIAKLTGKALNVKKGDRSNKCAILLGCATTDARLPRMEEDEWYLHSDGRQLLIGSSSVYYGTAATTISLVCDALLNELLTDGDYADSLDLVYSVQYPPVEVSIEGIVPENIRAIPDDVYETPYREDQLTTVYAPWLKLYHLTSRNEYQSNLNGGEGCQLVRSFAVSPIDQDVMYLITDTTGVWKTETGGDLWYQTSKGIPTSYGGGVLCDKNDINTVYVYMVGSGAFRSTNGGRTWTRLISDTGDFRSYNSTRFAQDDDGNTYIAAGSGIYKIEPNSDKMVNLYARYADLTGSASAYFTDIYVSEDGMDIYVAGSEGASAHTYIAGKKPPYVPGLYISHDGGKSWEIKNLFSQHGTVVFSITVDPMDSDHILVAAKEYDTVEWKSYGMCTLFESRDGGKNFNAVRTFDQTILQLRFGVKRNDGVTPIYMQTNTDASFTALRVSYDNGKTFAPLIADGNTARVGSWYAGDSTHAFNHYGYWFQPFVVDYSKPDTLYTADYGISKYENGKLTWIGSGFSGGSVKQFYMDAHGNMIIELVDMGTSVSSRPYSSENSRATFERVNGTVLTMFVIDPNNPNHIIGFKGENYVGSEPMGIVESFDKGKTFSGIKSGTLLSDRQNTALLKYVGSNTIYATQYSSKDNGKTWQKNQYYLYDVSDDGKRMIAQDPATNDILFSSNGGASWTIVANVQFNTNRYATTRPTQMVFDTEDANKVWVCDAKKFGYIDLSAKKMVDMTSKFSYPKFNYFAQNPENPDHLLVLTLYTLTDLDKNPNLYESTDGGVTWHTVPGFVNTYYSTIFFSKTTDEVFIGGHMGTIIYDYNEYWDYLESVK
ncbi:MAG: hypothetical protein J6C26_00340 [Clostridia bacterium]|nr:hypothetical protein [Clostridia bacterium]